MTTTTHTHRFLQRGQPWPDDITCDCGYRKFWAPTDDPEAKDDFDLALREALAAERRATVERIRDIVRASWTLQGSRYNDLMAILDEEAAR